MNLKEAFTYQNYLDRLMAAAQTSIVDRDHTLVVHKKHLRHKANADAEDMEETVDTGEFFPNDDVIRFIAYLTEQRYALSTAITDAKMSIDFDMDAALTTNQYRRGAASAIKRMLHTKAGKRTESGLAYKFNAEGNETPYRYEIEVTTEEAFDRAKSRAAMKALLAEANETSQKIDAAMVNTEVDYEAPFATNDEFEEAVTAFLDAERSA